jgi:hypothetical protein
VVGRFHVASGQFAGFELGSGAVVSGRVASGQIGFGHLANASVQSGTVASGIVFGMHLFSPAALSGHIGSGAVVGQAGGGFFNIASGTITTNDLASGAVNSGQIASGQITNFKMASGAILSGHIGNQAVVSGSVASGTLVSFVRQVVEEYNTEEAISGLKAVFLSSGGFVGLANAASGLRLPALGVVPANYVSGDVAVVVSYGKITTPMCSGWSGFVGKHLYCGSGGQIVGKSGLLSGMAWQKLGVAFSGGIYVNIDLTILSGGYTVGIGGNTEVF